MQDMLMNWLSHDLVLGTLVFLVKSIAVTFLVITVIGFIFGAVAKNKKKPSRKLKIKDLGQKINDDSFQLKKVVFNKEIVSNLKKSQKKDKKVSKKRDPYQPITYVLNFDGDVKASQVEFLRDEISALLDVVDAKKDEVVLRLESRGGTVHGYGLAASQLQRLRDKKIPLTICIDKVAASGGYMMACVGSRILAAPFAIVGSIGVITGIPNMHRLLKKHDVDYEEVTAGEYKRTISYFGAISDKGRQKLVEQVEDIHTLFKDFVSKNRPALNMGQVATGEYWYGIRAKELGLVDDLCSSDDFIMNLLKKKRRVLEISIEKEKEKFFEKLGKKLSYTFFSSLFSNRNSALQELARNKDPHLPEVPTDYLL